MAHRYGGHDSGATGALLHRIHVNYAPTDDLSPAAFIRRRKLCADLLIRHAPVTKTSKTGLNPARTWCGTQSMRSLAYAIVFGVVFVAAPPGAALAQSTSAVSGSEVTAGEHLVDYRFAYSPENDGRDEGFVHRFHYQYGFTERLRGRALITFGKRGAEPLKARTASLEALYQFKERAGKTGWDSAIRLDGNIPLEEDKPGRGRVAWHNQYKFENGVELRGVLLLGREFGDLAGAGASIETRAEATYKLKSGVRVGAQMFNLYGTTANFGSFDDQRHQIGPVLKGRIGEHLRYETSVLVGVSKAASDADFRLFFSYTP